MRTALHVVLALLTLSACDGAVDDVATIGGTYVGVGATVGDTITLTIPSGTESDADATFNVTLTFSTESDPFSGTAVYDDPSLAINLPGFTTYDCPVTAGGGSITCQFEIDRVTLTR